MEETDNLKCLTALLFPLKRNIRMCCLDLFCTGPYQFVMQSLNEVRDAIKKRAQNLGHIPNKGRGSDWIG